MGLATELEGNRLVVRFTGWDALAALRRRLVVDLAQVRRGVVEDRVEAERGIGARLFGLGHNDGWRKQGGRRVGRMLGRDAPSRHESWAVSSSADEVLVLEMSEGECARFVFEVSDPQQILDQLPLL